jgi:CheY-like chemotaxis protein
MKKKVLLIEADQIFANVYRNKLILDGFQVEVAHDGEIGLRLLNSFRPDAILLDLILPKVSGVDVIKKIRSGPDFAQLPLIVFLNTYLTDVVQEAWKAGATKCLAKANCTPNQVIGTLLGLLSEKAAAEPPPDPTPVIPAPSIPMPATEEQREAGVAAADAAFQTELRKLFVDRWPATLTSLRTMLKGMIKAENEEVRLQYIQQLYGKIHSLTGSANIVGLSQIAQLADALEALLKELQESPETINASTLRTVASAIDSLGVLFVLSGSGNKRPSSARVLVVDDEVISRRAITHALDKARLKSVNVEDPLEALQMLSKEKYDLIFLDVDMPNLNGFELCTRLRALPAYKKTPVVFITGLNDFESRANSTMSGGNDFIAKPFMFIELAVKALIYVLRGQLQQPRP